MSTRPLSAFNSSLLWSSKTADTTTAIASSSNFSDVVTGAPTVISTSLCRPGVCEDDVEIAPSSFRTTTSSPITASRFAGLWSRTVTSTSSSTLPAASIAWIVAAPAPTPAMAVSSAIAATSVSSDLSCSSDVTSNPSIVLPVVSENTAVPVTELRWYSKSEQPGTLSSNHPAIGRISVVEAASVTEVGK